MKTKILTLATVIFIVVINFNSCKKSENDPFLSLRSRDSRLTGTWKLTEQNYEITEKHYVGGSTSISEYSANVYDGVMTVNGTYSYSFSYEIEFIKDGSYNMSETDDGYRSQQSGAWWWLDSKKSKTGIAIDNSFFTIDKLSNKELTLKQVTYSKVYNSADEYVITDYSLQMTFEKKK